MPRGWAQYTKGRWDFDAASRRPAWVGEASWESRAAREGRWAGAGTYGRVWVPERTGRGGSWPVPTGLAVFLRIPGTESLIGWILLGPRDDLTKILRSERTQGEAHELRLENFRPSGCVWAIPESEWPTRKPVLVRHVPAGTTIVVPIVLGEIRMGASLSDRGR